MRSALKLCAAGLLLLGTSAAVNAQDDIAIDVSAVAGYFAITTTPVGSATLHAPGLAGESAERRFRAQFGYADEDFDVSRRSLLLGLDLPVGGGASNIGLDLGIADIACDLGEFEDLLGVEVNCGSLFMLGGRWSSRLLSSALGSSSGSELQLGIVASAGAGFGDYIEITDGIESAEISATSLAAGVDLPLMLVAQSGSTAIIPMIAPGFAYGRTSQSLEFEGEDVDATESGVQFVLSAGLGFRFGESAIGLDAGVRKVFADDAPTVVGVGMSIRM